MRAIYQGKQVLITGHTGFKGSWLAAWLTFLGARVTGVALKPNTNPNHFSLLDLDIDSYFIDVRDHSALAEAIKKAAPEVIFHLAAQPLVRDSYVDPLYTFETNVMGTANVLNACRGLESVKAVVVVTTDKCYENKEWVWGYREVDPMGGYDPYSASKGCAELVVSSFRRSFFNLDQYGKTHHTLIASARGGNVIGGGDWSKDRLIPDIVRAAASHEAVPIRSPHATRPWQHVLDCLSGYLRLGEKLCQGEKAFAEAWNFGPADSEMDTVLHVLQKMQLHWPSIQYSIDQRSSHPHEANLLKLDCSKAHTLLKWKNAWDLDEAVSRTVSWYRHYYEKGLVATFEDIKGYETMAGKD